MYSYEYSYNVDYSDAAASGMFGAIFGMLATMWLLILVISIVLIIAQWRIFSKAGKPGWAALIPFYNNYTLFSMLYSSGWWFLLTWIPFIGFVFAIIAVIDMARAFGKSVGFAIGLIFLSPIFYCILGFGHAEYLGVQKSSPFGSSVNQTGGPTTKHTSDVQMSQDEAKEMLRQKLQKKQNTSKSPFEE